MRKQLSLRKGENVWFIFTPSDLIQEVKRLTDNTQLRAAISFHEIGLYLIRKKMTYRLEI